MNWNFGAATSSTGAAFSSAAGTGWTNASNVIAEDAASATYSGTAQDWLAIRTGGYYPGSESNHRNYLLSFQNVILKGLCSAGDCTDDGSTIQIAWSRDGVTPLAPIRDVVLTQSNATVTVCATSPCAVPNAPDDRMVYADLPMESLGAGNGLVWNDASNPLKVFFKDVYDCNMLQDGDEMKTGDGSARLSAILSGKNCAATPPQFTLSNEMSFLSANGTTGVHFRYWNGISKNRRYSLLVRKKSTTKNSTISLDYAAWRTAAVTQTRPGWAGSDTGSTKTCASLPTVNGFYHCIANGSSLFGIRSNDGGDPEVRPLGDAKFNSSVGEQIAYNNWGAYKFSDTDANVMYATAWSETVNPETSVKDYRHIIVKWTYTGGDLACGTAGAGCAAANPFGAEHERHPRAPHTRVNLTKCESGCTLPEHDFSIRAQMKRFSSAPGYSGPVYDPVAFPSCGVVDTSGNYILVQCNQSIQDTPAWVAVFEDTGTRAEIVALLAMFARFPSRYSANHGAYFHNGTNIVHITHQWTYYRSQLASPLGTCGRGSTCDACPSTTVRGFDYTGMKLCQTIQVTSNWDPAWGTAPSWWAPGEPTDGWYKNLQALVPIQPGDTLRVDGSNELIRVVKKNSSGEWVVERGFGSYDNLSADCYRGTHGRPIGQMQAVSAGTALRPSYGGVCHVYGNPSYEWHFLLDPQGTGEEQTYYGSQIGDHGAGWGDVRLADYRIDVSLPPPGGNLETYKWNSRRQPNGYYSRNPEHIIFTGSRFFSGAHVGLYGNSLESHPSNNNRANSRPADRYWFVDDNPVLHYPSFAVTQISGNLYRYNLQVDNNNVDWRTNPKVVELGGFCGDLPLKNVSGPGSALTGELTDSYKYCVAGVAGECTSGSQVNQVFVNCPTLHAPLLSCRGGEFYNLHMDVCLGNTAMNHNAYTQWIIPRIPGAERLNGQTARLLSRVGHAHRSGSLRNAKPTPDGKFLLSYGPDIMKLPPLPAADNINRSEFIGIPVKLTPPDGLGVGSAVVEFGYNPSFHCTSRPEACVSNSASVNRVNPFTWPSETGGIQNISGLACSSGCTVMLPALSQKVLYYRVRYRNGSHQDLAVGRTKVITTP